MGNGGITTLKEADECQEQTKCDGIMVASAILINPTFFSGSPVTTPECVEYWLKISKGMKWQLFQHHLSFMTESLIDKQTRVQLNDQKQNEEIFRIINDEFAFNLDFHKDYDLIQRIPCPGLYNSVEEGEDDDFKPGKYFSERYKEAQPPPPAREKTLEDPNAVDDINFLFS